MTGTNSPAQTPKLTNNCPKCAAFDVETKATMAKLFSQEEQISLAIMIGQNISATLQKLKTAAPGNHLRAKNQANVDYLSAMLSKFFVSLDGNNLNGVKHWLKSFGGVEFNRLDEQCPHKGMQRWQRIVAWLAYARKRVALSLKRS